MRKSELIQGLNLCIATLKRINGRMPEAFELYAALGSEYEEVLEEYFHGKCAYDAAA